MIDKDKMACNKPQRTPSHPKSSHVVKACEDGKERVIRFGQQGVSGSPKKEGESESYRKRRESFKARHAKNIAKGKMSAAYWANKTKWAEGGHVTGMAGGGSWGSMAAAGPVGGSAKAAADREKEKAKEAYGRAAASMRAAGVTGIGGRSVAADRSGPMVERTQAGDLGNLVEIYGIQDDSPSVASVPVATPVAIAPAASVPSQPTGFLETLKAIPSGIANDLKMGYQAGIFRGRDTQRENLMNAGYNPAQIDDYFARTDATLARNQTEAATRGDRDVQPTNQYDDLARKFAQEYNIVGRNRSQLMPLLESFLRMRGVLDPSSYYENIFNTLSVPMQHGGSVKLEDLVEKYEQGGKARPSLLAGFMQELNRLRSLQARQDAQEFRPENVDRTRPVARRDDRAPTRANAAVQGRTDGMPTGAVAAPTGDVYRDTAIALAERYGLPPNVFVSLVQNESAYNPNARSPVGAIGLAQLMPDTARELGVDPTDWRQNLEGGARYLRQQLDTFGSLPLALAAYNAGPGNVRKYNGIPPFRETQNYVSSVLRDAGIPGYAEGGAVTTYDPAAVEARIASMGKGYATGGAVQYDPAAVDQLVNTVREGKHV